MIERKNTIWFESFFGISKSFTEIFFLQISIEIVGRVLVANNFFVLDVIVYVLLVT